MGNAQKGRIQGGRGGGEIYFTSAEPLAGRTLGDALHAFPTSSVIGLATREGVRVLPAMDTRIGSGDRIIAISEDDDTLLMAPAPQNLETSAIVNAPPASPRPEHTLVIGWNWRAPSIVAGLDAYVAEGSRVLVVADGDHEGELMDVKRGLRQQTLGYRSADTTDRDVLESLDVASFDHVILLCSDELSTELADARVLVTLLHLREIGDRLGRAFSIVSEMRDVRNRELAEVTQADDFIVSDKLVSLMLCQVAENKQLNAVLSDLFDPEGAEIYLKPASDYVKLGVAVSFHTVVESARRRGEAAIGYRLAEKQKLAAEAYGVVVNPDKRATVTFGVRDKVVVVAES